MSDDGIPSADGHEDRNLGHVTSRRDVLRGAAALGAAAAGLPAVKHLGVTSTRPATSTRPDPSPTLWNGQQVTQPIGLSSVGTPRRGGDLTWAWIFTPIAQMDPQMPTTGDNGDLGTLLWIYDQLTNIKPGTLTNEAGLAESWDVEQGGLVYTFHLRDAEFSNGDKVLASDVQFTLERFANPKINSQYAFLNAIDKVEALNSNTVRVTLQYVQGMFPQVVGHATSGIVPQRVVEKLGKDFAQHPIGSGPFMFESKTPGQQITLKRNPNYWKSPKPYIDSATFTYVTDDDARMLQVTRGLADIGFNVPYALLEAYRDVPGTRLQLEPYTNVILAVPNIKRPPLDEKNVRLALNWATPRPAINSAVFKNAPRIANSAIGQLRYWDPTVPDIGYDLSKAKSYLAQSSVPKGFDTSLLIVGSDSDSVSVATILQSAWAEIGISLKIEDVDLDTMFARFYSTTNPDYDINFFPPTYSSTDVGDDDEMALFFYEPLSVNFGGYFYDDPDANKLVNQATHSIDVPLRKKDFAALQRYCLFDDPPIIPFGFGPNAMLVNSRVQGLRTLLNQSWRLEDVWLNP
ncbi:MAG: ABC transporter substrate-binding protein [Acidimicrobiales bacterium]|jgi:peptide/nickel transport system substrate-binding protein